MSSTLQHHIIQQVENLIEQSCTSNTIENPQTASFHRALLKKYFGAEAVYFDRDVNAVRLKLKEDQWDSDTISLHLDYNNLADILKTFIERDQSSLRFYKGLLSYYHIAQPLSA